MEYFILENEFIKLEISKTNGALCGLFSKKLNWAVLDRAELGLSFRLLVPISEEKRNNNVFGEEQKLSEYDFSQGKSSIKLIWHNLNSENISLLDIKVEQNISLEDEKIIFQMQITNNTNYIVETVYTPYLGDMRHPDNDDFGLMTPVYASMARYSLWPKYQNIHGYFGVDYPTQYISASTYSPFALLCTENKGLYCGVYKESYECTAWHTELRPGYENSIDQSVPKEKTIAGKPVHMLFATVHEAYVLPNESRALTPIMLKAYEGDWHFGVDIYKEWRNSWMKIKKPAPWINEPHSWLQIHVNSPEDELRWKFTELPNIAAECKKYNVAAIQLVGWNDGGQDQGNPSHNFDPRLGTHEELKEAIAQCQAMGVKIMLFTKFIWADRGTEWFRKELKNYAVKDPYGDYYMHNGYQYQTATQLLDINTKRLIPMCFNCEPYIKICEEEFAKVVELGAKGMLFDECLHHWPSKLCFDTTHGHRYAMPVYSYDNKLIERFRKLAPKDFAMCGEACYDFEMQQYEVAYFRTESKNHLPLYPYMLPNGKYMTAVTGFDDRDMLNQCLMYHYIVSYEPYNFKGRLSDFPATIKYGMRLQKVRTELRKWLWDGEFRDTVEGEVTYMDGSKHRQFSVFKASDGSQAMVIVNYETTPIEIKASLNNGNKLTKYRLADNERWHEFETISIPAHSAAIVL